MDVYSTKPAEIFNMWAKHPDDIIHGTSGQDVFTMVPHHYYEFNNDDSCIVIASCLVTGIHDDNLMSLTPQKLREYLLSVVTPDNKILFDNMYEGNVTPFVAKIYEAIEGTFISPSNVFYFTAALNARVPHNAYCESHGITDRINVYTCNTWEYSLFKSSEIKNVEYEIRPKSKNFLCFNRILRPHRLALVCLLLEKDLVKDSYYSFFPHNAHTENHPMNWAFRQLQDSLSASTYRSILLQFQKYEKVFPLKLNIEPGDNRNFIKKDDLSLFQESYFSLVTETYFFVRNQYGHDDEDAIFFTEKIFKPILMKHPFILLSRPGSLEYLRRLGYKTFSPFINEEYDTMENNEDRLLAIVAETERLSKFTTDEWITWQTNIKNIVEHNHSIIHARKKHMYVHLRNDNENQH